MTMWSWWYFWKAHSINFRWNTEPSLSWWFSPDVTNGANSVFFWNPLWHFKKHTSTRGTVMRLCGAFYKSKSKREGGWGWPERSEEWALAV
jgi:hypothetical protein